MRFPDLDNPTNVVAAVTLGDMVFLEVTDSDLDDAGQSSTDVYAECDVNGTFSLSTLTPASGALTTSTVPIISPILDSNGDGFVIFSDVTVGGTSGVAVLSVDAANGIITLICTQAQGDGVLGGNDGVHFSITYNHAVVDRTSATPGSIESVKVTSDADPVGITIRLEETGRATGVFRGAVKLVSGASSNTLTCRVSSCGVGSTQTDETGISEGDIAQAGWTLGSIQVGNGDTLVLTSEDLTSTGGVTRTASLAVEAVASIPTPTATPTPPSVPGSSAWGLIVLALVIAGAAAWMFSRKRTAPGRVF